MEIRICKDPSELGKSAAGYVAGILNECIEKKGSARIVLSTGASQFDTLDALIKEKVDWSRVEMFHLDEYINIDETHKASFRKYLREKFISKVNLKKAYLVDGTESCITTLTEEIRKAPVDVGLIGIGENAHIAFNDPPADFDTKEAYIVVNLNDACKRQQVREGWFGSVDEVPKQAVSMSVYQIMQCEHIVSCVPYAVKAKAVADTLANDLTNNIPATMLKKHKNFILYVDMDSAKDIISNNIVY
mgnify:CR=1 FL=1|jgi:glucosamine-6-phosphate deaminase